VGVNDNKDELIRVLPFLQDMAKQDPDFLKKLLFKNKGESFDKFKESLKELINLHENPPKCINKQEQGKLSAKKGRMLENLADYLMIESSIYKIKTNLKNDTNEIDLLLQFNDLGLIASSVLPTYMREDIIIECKNYNTTIGVTWLGKVASLLDIHNVKLCVLFSYHPISGKQEWLDGKGFIKKLFLKKNIAIININVDDLNNIANEKYTFPEIIQNKYDSIKYHTDIEQYISIHPAEGCKG